MIPVRVARILLGARMLWRSFVAVAAVLVGIGIAVQCSGCGAGGFTAAVAAAKPIALVTCAIARRVQTVCDIADIGDSGAVSLPPTSGGEE